MINLIVGDCRDILKTIPSGSVDTCITSPPYWGLRNYGVDGQIGLEASIDGFIAEMVTVFAEVRRVLRDDGTLWLNLGDSYNNNRTGGNGATGGRDKSTLSTRMPPIGTTPVKKKIDVSLKPKDMMGVPWRVAFALQADGWYLRQDIIWHKPNPMPESVTDRCTKAHEYIFLLSKSPKYYFDQDAILEECSPNTHARISQDLANQVGSERANGGAKTNGNMKAVMRKGKTGDAGFGVKNNATFAAGTCMPVEKRNKRSVWTVGTKGFSEAHFATFPPDLIEPCVLAGCPEFGVILDPFFGAGTTGLVADRHHRNCIGIELNPQYADMAVNRLRKDGGFLADIRMNGEPDASLLQRI